jgi:uncharacterized protein YkwD
VYSSFVTTSKTESSTSSQKSISTSPIIVKTTTNSQNSVSTITSSTTKTQNTASTTFQSSKITVTSVITLIRSTSSSSTVTITSKTSTTTTTSSVETPKSSGSPASWGAECLSQHNIHRASCETIDGLPIPALSWDSNLARDAQIWANTLASQNRFYHSIQMKWGHGENLYAVTLNGNLNCKPAVDAFFNEYKLYNNEPIGQGNFEAYGHFTQLAWPTTTKIGCAYADGTNWRYTVCEYDPP